MIREVVGREGKRIGTLGKGVYTSVSACEWRVDEGIDRRI